MVVDDYRWKGVLLIAGLGRWSEFLCSVSISTHELLIVQRLAISVYYNYSPGV